jgi:Ca2+-binding EF-hand superfamily protein
VRMPGAVKPAPGEICRVQPLKGFMKPLLCISIACWLAMATAAHADDAFAALDVNHDGMVDEEEAQAAGRVVFKRLDKDQDGRLDPSEIDGRLGPAVLKAADPGADSALNGEEYAALITARFKGANADGDGKVSRSELTTLTGALLLVMIK